VLVSYLKKNASTVGLAEMVKSLFIIEGGGLQKWVPYSIIALAIAVGGYFVYATWTADNKPFSSPWICMDDQCGHVENLVPKLGDPAPPLICKKCGKKSLVPARLCPNCGAFVVMNYWRGKSGVTKCPNCAQELYYDD